MPSLRSGCQMCGSNDGTLVRTSGAVYGDHLRPSAAPFRPRSCYLHTRSLIDMHLASTMARKPLKQVCLRTCLMLALSGSSHSTAVFAGRTLRVSAVIRRVAAAYGDANVLVKKAFTPHFLAHFEHHNASSQGQKDAHLKMDHDGTKRAVTRGR